MKKKHIIIIQLIVVLIFLVFPTFALPGTVPSPSGHIIKFSFFSVFQLIIAILFNIEHKYLFKDQITPFRTGFERTVNHLRWGAFTMGFLMLSFMSVSIIEILLSSSTPESTEQVKIKLTLIKVLIMIFNVICASFYEETVYRQLLPFSFRSFMNKNKVLKTAAETAALLLFAAGHLYLGLPAVVNALICGIILRLCYIKTRSPYTGTAVHFIYNLTLFTFALL